MDDLFSNEKTFEAIIKKAISIVKENKCCELTDSTETTLKNSLILTKEKWSFEKENEQSGFYCRVCNS